MSTSRPSTRRRSFPVTVTQLPVVRCAECGRTMAHRTGEASAVLTAHYEQVHLEAIDR
ncbi:MAG: hypothetical protein IPG94_03975 [Kineosporiaceae bacterium]|nr:hypothetical protein [Kineosporiaceae bacterium]